MAEPLKNLFSPDLVRAMAGHLARIDGVDADAFVAQVLPGWDELEMMQRSDRIAEALKIVLPPDFQTALAALQDLLHPDAESLVDSSPPDRRGLRGWSLVPVGKFVADRGLDHPRQSLAFLREMTKRFSAEFAVRPFFRDHPDLTLDHARAWARDANFHVRRLASEGSRPRLPWGLRLQRFVVDPMPLLPILETLRDDPSDYVRRSVANNLNDVAKDHPDLVARLAGDLMQGANEPRRKLVKHACRSLIKAGHPATLAIFGYGPPEGLNLNLSVSPKKIRLGGTLEVTADLRLTADRPLSVLVDLIARFRKSNQQLSPKVFKWTETRLKPGQALRLRKALPLRDVTTRRHYPGKQGLAVQVNGVTLAETEFDLRSE